MSQVTKRALEQSLKNLLLKKPLTKITISDITEDCGINRMTFYYHFKDIYDLVEWACLEDAKRALDEKKTYDTWQQGLLQIFEAVQENKPFILNVYRCVHREQVEKYLQPLVDQLMLDVTDLPEEVKPGDVVTMFGTDGDASITADELAALYGTIGYEIVCGISKRVPRNVLH